MQAMKHLAKLIAFAVIPFALVAFAVPAVGQSPRSKSGPASPLSSQPVLSEAPDRQLGLALVPASEGWIAFWSDELVRYGSTRILATRLRLDGSVVDPTGIRTAEGFGWQSWAYRAVPDPAGARFFWALPGTTGPALRTVTIDDRGERSEEIVVGVYPSDASLLSLRVATTGTRNAVLVDRYLMILENTRLLRTIDLGGRCQDIVAAGSHFLATCVADAGVLMRQTLDLDGNAVGPPGGSGVASRIASHVLASDGEHALLAWRDATPAWQNGDTIRISTIDPESGTLTETASISAPGENLHAVWTGSSYLVTWPSAEKDAILGLHVSAGGAILDDEPGLLAVPRHDVYEIGVRNGALALLYSSEKCSQPYCDDDVYVAMLGDAGTTGDALISAAARPQHALAVASDGTRFLALWKEEDKIFATETTALSRAPSAPIALLGGISPYTERVSVSSNGSGYFTAWAEYRDPYSTRMRGALLSRVGETLSPRILSFDTGRMDPVEGTISTGASSELYFVAWEDEDSLQGARVLPDGTLVDTVPITLGGYGFSLEPSPIAFDGRDFIVTEHHLSGEVGDIDTVDRLITQRVSASGTVRFDRTWTTGAYGSIKGASLACSNVEVCLMIWSEVTPDSLRIQLLGQRFHRGSDLIDATPFVLDASEFDLPGHVAWNGARFVVTWNKYAGDFFNIRFESRTIATTGVVEQDPPDIVLIHEGWFSGPAATCNQEVQCMLVNGEGVDDATHGRSWRLFKRFFGEPRQRPVRR